MFITLTQEIQINDTLVISSSFPLYPLNVTTIKPEEESSPGWLFGHIYFDYLILFSVVMFFVCFAIFNRYKHREQETTDVEQCSNCKRNAHSRQSILKRMVRLTAIRNGRNRGAHHVDLSGSLNVR